MTSLPTSGELAGVRPLLDRLALIGGPEDTRPVEDVLEDLDRQTAELARVVGSAAADERRDQLIADVERLRESVLEGPEAIGALREKIGAARRALGLDQARSLPSAAERVLARSGQPLVHIPTGLPTWDEITRGGLLARRLHVVAGEPDAGKTALALQAGVNAARAGVAVLWYAVDEPRDGIEDRIGQAYGLALDDLEAAGEKTIAELSAVLRDLPNLQIVDQAQDRLVLEEGAEMLAALKRRCGALQSMLIVDSLQTAKSRGLAGGRFGDRERVELVTGAARDIAFTGPLVLATSEVGRSAYRARNARDRSAEMAAAKGSGAIEFYATFFGVLSRIGKGEHAGDVRFGYPKNKRGTEARGALRFSYDRDRCWYTDHGRLEGESEETTAGAPKAPAERPVAEQLLERVRYTLKSRPRGIPGGIEALIEAVGGKTSQARRAVRQLQAADEIVRQGDRLFHRDTAAPKPSPATSAELREHVVSWLEGELAAGRPVPSTRAVVAGLREAGHGARPGAIRDAIDVLTAPDGPVERSDAGVISLR